MTFEEVIEEHRAALGAVRVHVDIAPGATPEGVRQELARLRDKTLEWRSFPEELRLRAEIDQLKARLSRLGRLAKTDFREFENQHPEVTALKKAIFAETDIIALDQEEALRFCRERTGVIEWA